MAIKKTSPRRPERRQTPQPPEWHQRAYRAWGVKKKPQPTWRERLAAVPLVPKTRRMTAIYFIAAMSMVLILLAPMLTPVPPEPLPVPTHAASDTTPPAVQKPTWPTAPLMAIDTSKTYRVTMETEKGVVKAELFTKDAPVTVNNFVFLARQGFYDNLSFHRVINSFMAQGGDPSGNGTGGPGYKFADEIANNPQKVDEGVLAMANSGPNTNGSQFFITTAAAPHLNGLHTVFGKVTEGMDVVKKLTPGDPLPPAQLNENLIKKVTIEE